jgi:hypothetical protein
VEIDHGEELNRNFGSLSLDETFDRFCYIAMDFTTAASQNGVCTTQVIRHIHKYLVSQLFFAKT